MNTYILLYKQEDINRWNRVHFDEAPTRKDFLSEVPDFILKKYEWRLFEAEELGHQDDFIHSGEIDEILPKA